MIAQSFGSARGLARLALSYPECLPGLSAARPPRAEAVRRLVFVCHGNICRSAYAEALARALGAQAASFGLFAVSGTPAHPPIAECAALAGLSLVEHGATSAEDFQPRDGDYLLAMEHRHLRALAAEPRFAHLPRGLLGAWARPPLPHLHDPYQLDPDYLRLCCARIDAAVGRLVPAFPCARTLPQ